MARDINFGESEADAKYQISDDGTPGNFVLARDTNGATVLLEWDATNSEWVFGGPVEMGSDGITTTGAVTAGSLSTEQIGAERYYAEAFDGADADARLDNALSAASGGDVIYLENTDYTDARTITTQVIFVGTRVSYGNNGTLFTGTLTVDGRCNFENVAFSADVTANGKYTTFDNTPLESTSTITAAADYISITRATLGSVVFQSGTSNGIVDACRGTSVTDNGTNTVGDVA